MYNVALKGLMVVRRRRQWFNIKTTSARLNIFPAGARGRHDR